MGGIAFAFANVIVELAAELPCKLSCESATPTLLRYRTPPNVCRA